MELIKEKIKNKLISLAELEVAKQKEIVQAQKELSTHSDLKSEGKYDTRAIEAAYLSDAQRKRLEELEQDLELLNDLSTEKSEIIQIGSIAELEHKNSKRFYYFASNMGGTMIEVDGVTYLIISVFSPLGNEAIGLKVGESFTLETPKEERVYSICQVI